MNSRSIRILKSIALTILVLGISYGCASGQQINAIQSKCPSPNQLTASSVRALADGNITYTPCPTFASIFFGNVDFSNATVTGLTGLVTGTGTTNFLPLWTDGANSVLGDSVVSWDGSLLSLDSGGSIATLGDVNNNVNATKLTLDDSQQNLTFTSGGVSFLNLFPQSGLYQIGDVDGFANGLDISVNDAGKTINIDSRDGEVNVGDGDGNFNTTRLSIADQTSVGTLQAGGAAAVSVRGSGAGAPSSAVVISADSAIQLISAAGEVYIQTPTLDMASGSVLNFQFFRTITAGGTTGAQIINKPAGTVNFAAAATSLVVTNSIVTADSIILLMARTNDATCSVKNYVAGAGSFTINMTAACTAETSVGFLVTN